MDAHSVEKGFWIRAAALAAAAALLAAAAYFGTILLLLFAGALLAVLLDGISVLLQRYLSVPRPLAFGSVLLLFFLALVGLVFAFGPLFLRGVDQLAETIGQHIDELSGYLQSRPWGRSLLGSGGGGGGSIVASAFNTVAGLFSITLWSATAALIILVSGIYLAAEPQVYARGISRLFPRGYQRRVRGALREAAETLHWWLIGRFASMAVVGVLTWLGLTLLDLPLAATLGLLAALLSFIPNVGPILSAVPAVLIGLDQSVHVAIYVVVLYIAIQTVESYFITPLIQRRAVRLPPVLIIGAQLVGAWAYGTIGILVATPLTVVVIVFIDEFHPADAAE